MKYLFAILALGLIACGPSYQERMKAQMTYMQVACDNGQTSACIEYADALTRQRIAQEQALAYINASMNQTANMFSNFK